jgi:antagonist of KipI
MSLLIHKEGVLTTVQDLGRWGFRDLGINPSGVMDPTATRLINILLGNAEDDAVLEFHFPAGTVVFEKSALFALGGAEFDARLNGAKIENWRPYFAEGDAEIKFSGKKSGARAYLSVCGGFALEEWLGSHSTNLTASAGGFEGRRLRTGDRIDCCKHVTEPSLLNYSVSRSLIPIYRPFPTVRIVAGAEFEMLSDESRDTFLESGFTVSKESNRMGYRLLGDPLQLSNKVEMLSSAVSFGTIQLLPDGNLIVLMADHQTTGGYPRIANVISLDLPLLAQLNPNDKVAFHLVLIEEAEILAEQFEYELNLLKIGCRFKNLAGRKI